MAHYLLISLIVSLFLTLVSELLFALVWGLRSELWTVVRMNVLTNPAVVATHFLITRFTLLPELPCIVILEVLVVAAEAHLCRNTVRRPWLFALCINLFSYGVGLLLQLI